MNGPINGLNFFYVQKREEAEAVVNVMGDMAAVAIVVNSSKEIPMVEPEEIV